MHNIETGELQYLYASHNNNHLFDSPFQIATAADLKPVREALRDMYVLEWVRRGLLPLDRNAETGKVYNDNLCFFPALPNKKKFSRVELKELPDLEHLF